MLNATPCILHLVEKPEISEWGLEGGSGKSAVEPIQNGGLGHYPRKIREINV